MMGKIYKRLSPKIGLRIKDGAENRLFFIDILIIYNSKNIII